MAWIRKGAALWLSLCFLLSFSAASAEFTFSDDRFRGRFTTENLDAIIDEYELFDGWYWTTRANIPQTFHGHPESPGWTVSAEEAGRKVWKQGWYGCRFPVDRVLRTSPDKGGYAECFAFAQFIGYLLSGEFNPQHNWTFYYSVDTSGPLQVGDIIRTEYTKNGRQFGHSAVVYAVNGEEYLFLQVSGSNYNRISVGAGFNDGRTVNATTLEEIADLSYLKISRYQPED